MTNYAVVGCMKCGRLMIANLAHEYKMCQCGHLNELENMMKLALRDSPEEAAQALQNYFTGIYPTFMPVDRFRRFSELYQREQGNVG